MHAGFLAEGVLDSHAWCYSPGLCSLLYVDYREMLMKSNVHVSDAKVLRRFGTDRQQQAGGLILFNHFIFWRGS